MNKLIEDFLKHKEVVKGTSKNTSIIYGNHLEIFFDFLKKKFNSKDIDIDVIKKVDSNIVCDFMKSIEKCNKAVSRSNKLSCLRSFFRYLKQTKQINENPASDVDSPKIGQRISKFLSVDEGKKLLSVIENKRDYAIFILFLNCGLRLNELVNINLSDISDNKLTVIGKGDKERMIPLNKTCIDSINDYLQTRDDKLKALFVDSKPDPVYNKKIYSRITDKHIQYLVKCYIKKAGLNSKISTHKLRHTAATIMYQNGTDLKELQTILGHVNIGTTSIYTKASNEQIETAINNNPFNIGG